MGQDFTALDQLCVNTIRTLSIDMIQKANSGHPGLPLGAAPMAYVLWSRHLRHNPSDPLWPDRDRFILSPGHGSALLYSLLHVTGYDLGLDELKEFRQWGSRTAGHPEAGLAPGVEATTGPLGQGTANAVGMAIAERHLANRFNRPGFNVVNHYTYALVSDGDIMEGISAEAASYAGHLKLGKLIYLYDANDISLDGPTSLTFSTEDVGKRYESYGWQVIHVADGDTDLAAIDDAIMQAKADTSRPSMIIVKTTIGYGSPNKAGSASSHGSPLGVDEVALTKKALGWDYPEDFYVPDEASAHSMGVVDRGVSLQAWWSEMFSAYAEEHAALAEGWHETLEGRLPEGWDTELPVWELGTGVASRAAGGEAINAIGKKVESLVTGAADLACSTKTNFKDEAAFDGQTGAGRVLFYGVREHAMTAMANGMAYHGGVRPVVSTFFVFSDYMRPAIRMANLNGLPVIYVWTHDSVGVGEDGPTHQPVEHLMALRSMPGLVVIRPADGNETSEAWRVAMEHTDGPVGLVFSRQKLATLEKTKELAREGVAKGAYVVAEPKDGEFQAILIATGSEVGLAVEATEKLAEAGISTRVVSMPSWELFEAQPVEYRESVLPPSVTARVTIEAGATFGWSRWAGDAGAMIGIDRFGASAPGSLVLDKLGINVEAVVAAVQKLLG